MNLIWAADRLINRCYCTPVCVSYMYVPGPRVGPGNRRGVRRDYVYCLATADNATIRVINNITPKELSNSSRRDGRLRCARKLMGTPMYARRTFDPETDECAQRRQ